MNKERINAIAIGLLFFISTASFLIGDELVNNITQSSDYLKDSYLHAKKIRLGVVLQLINNIAIMGIGILFFPILAKYNKKIAITYTGTRVIEGGLLFVSAVSILALIPLSEEFSKVTESNTSHFETIGLILRKMKDYTFQLAMIILSFGSLFFCYLLYKVQLVPKVIAVLGFIGYGLLMTKMISEILDYKIGGEILYIPGALFELLLPLWLIVKGFNSKKRLKSNA